MADIYIRRETGINEPVDVNSITGTTSREGSSSCLIFIKGGRQLSVSHTEEEVRKTLQRVRRTNTLEFLDE